MRTAGGGGCSDQASLDKLRKDYKCSEYHLVSPDAQPYADAALRIKKAGMKPVYDIEMEIWATKGFNVNLDISYLRPQLAAIKAAGWEAFSSEGVSQKQVSVLREYLPYINYGGERGEDVYSGGSMYYRPRTMADGNYLETYHKDSTGAYLQSLKSSNLSTPNNMGITLMMYTTASLEMDNAAMISFIQSALDANVKINTILFWAGVSDCPTRGLDGIFNSLYHALDNRFGFVIDGGGAQPIPIKVAIDISYGIYKLDPDKREVMFLGELFDAKSDPLPNSALNIYRASERGTTKDWVSMGRVVSDEWGGWRKVMPIVKGANYFFFVTTDGKTGHWTSDVIWV